MIPDDLWLQHYQDSGPVAAGADAVSSSAAAPSTAAPEYKPADLSNPFSGSGLSPGSIGASDPTSNTVDVGGPSMSNRIAGGLMSMGKGLMGTQTPAGLSTPGIASPYQMSDRRAKHDVRDAGPMLRSFLDRILDGDA